MINLLTVITIIAFIFCVSLIIVNRKILKSYVFICIFMSSIEVAFAFVEYLLLNKYDLVTTTNLLIPAVANSISLLLKGYICFNKKRDPLKTVSLLLSLQFVGVVGLIYVIIKIAAFLK